MSDIAVFGAGGRAGRAITAEARSRGHRITAVVRDPARHPGLAADGVRVVAGDVRDAAAVAAILPGHDAAVSTVTPASGPEALAQLGQLDERFFVTAVDALLAGMTATGVSRLVVIGLFANLLDEHGRMVLDDPAAFPPELRPFALAHTAGLDRLRAAQTPVDWLVLTPPAGLTPDGPRTGRYRTGGDRVPEPGSESLSYADLAVAVVDEIENPRHHRTRISVFR
ncbi:NAD(P)-dependent oxidoreductase [Micromonospora sp. HM5-17]|jgi:putative NADH-flavin reductase|uniref:NAD(P)-dependent oxidoreductase n=1 Tax=Micromonospora sp. HM5-17 TaxID=2487710 RepID=UPI000F4A8FDF|nr:NAD(P)H-binding protein [Micromonospora sp. HM5-17]ROT31470.1 NAD-dependent epimerase/dehydratase family protein [Micromonospora sp. HM5-17]